MAKLKTLNIMLDEGVKELYVNDRDGLPNRAHDTDAGIDLRCVTGGTVVPHGTHIFDTGVHVEIPNGYVGILASKSGLNVKSGLTSTGVIDSGYSGSIKVAIHNDSDDGYIFYRGDKLTQLLILPCEFPKTVLVDKFAESERGDAGFGSTGK